MDEDQRYEAEQTRKHRRIAFGILVLVIVCAAILGVRYWGRGLPSIGKGAAETTVAGENALSMTCHAFAIEPNEFYPNPIAPSGEEVAIVLLCRDIPAGEKVHVKVTRDNEVVENDVEMRATETPWTIQRGSLGQPVPGLYVVEYTYQGRLIARTYVEVL